MEDGEINDEGIGIEEEKDPRAEPEDLEKDREKEKVREKEDKSHRHTHKRHRKIKEKRKSKRRRRDRQKVSSLIYFPKNITFCVSERAAFCTFLISHFLLLSLSTTPHLVVPVLTVTILIMSIKTDTRAKRAKVLTGTMMVGLHRYISVHLKVSYCIFI